MKVGDLQESITVTGETLVVDIQNTVRETTISANTIPGDPGDPCAVRCSTQRPA